MRLKKLMAVACAAALTVTAFAGCSKKNDSSSGSDSKGDAKKEYYNAQPVDTGWEWGNVEIVDGGFIPDVIYNPTEEGIERILQSRSVGPREKIKFAKVIM